jgi:hypothetical protein
MFVFKIKIDSVIFWILGKKGIGNDMKVLPFAVLLCYARTIQNVTPVDSGSLAALLLMHPCIEAVSDFLEVP